MRTFGAAVLAGCVLAAGCTPPPKVTEGTFTDVYELTMQRGSMDVAVHTSGPAKYKVTNHSMNHPMGARPNTEAVFTTPAGTFNVSSHGDNDLGVIVNGVLYPEPLDRSGRSKVVIDAQGNITVQAAHFARIRPNRRPNRGLRRSETLMPGFETPGIAPPVRQSRRVS